GLWGATVPRGRRVGGGRVPGNCRGPRGPAVVQLAGASAQPEGRFVSSSCGGLAVAVWVWRSGWWATAVLPPCQHQSHGNARLHRSRFEEGLRVRSGLAGLGAVGPHRRGGTRDAGRVCRALLTRGIAGRAEATQDGDHLHGRGTPQG